LPQAANRNINRIKPLDEKRTPNGFLWITGTSNYVSILTSKLIYCQGSMERTNQKDKGDEKRGELQRAVLR
jgi:hypothetical protein